MSDPIDKSTTALERAKIPLPKVFKEESLFWFSWNTACLFTSRNLLGIFSNDHEYDNLRYYRASLIVVFGMAGQLTFGHTIFVAAGVFLSANITTV